MTRPRLDPDPLYVEPEPVRRLEPDEDSGMVIVYLFAAILGGLLIALVLSVWLAASRSAPDPGPSQASLTGQGRSGAPWSHLPAAPHSHRPAVTNVATSEGTPVPTTPTPAAIRYTGTATWYCSEGRHGSPRSACTRGYGPSDLIGAIDRKDTTFARGDRVTVRYGRKHVTVTIVDTCACADRRVIDLSIGAFERLAPWGMGVLSVTVELAGTTVELPETDR